MDLTYYVKKFEIYPGKLLKCKQVRHKVGLHFKESIPANVGEVGWG